MITQERLLLVCGARVALGALAIDAAAQEAPEPLWAYAYSTPPKPDDKATPQAAPTRNLRPNENAEETNEAETCRRQQRGLFARRHPRWPRRDRLVSGRAPADDGHHWARAQA